MEPLRWILLLAGVLLIAGVFCYSRGWYPRFKVRARDAESQGVTATDELTEDTDPVEQEPERKPAAPVLEPESKVIAVRIIAQGGGFPAEELVLALRAAGFRHGQFGIFHVLAEDGDRIRFSVADLVEPGSFDLSNLKDSVYKGVTMFTIVPAEEDGVQLFDDMVSKARELAKAIDGAITDEQGGTFSLQRERYMREELIDYLRRQEFSIDPDRDTAA